MRCCATCSAIVILRSATCRRSTTISAPATFVIRKPTSRRRRDCWGTTQRTTSVPGSARHYRGMNPARSSPPAGERRRCPMCAATPDRRRHSARRPRPRCLSVAGLAVVGLALAPAAVAELEPDPFAALPPWKQKIANQVALLAPRYALEPRLALAIIAVESNFEPGARSPKDARGLMQLVPKTASRFNVGNPYDIKDNLRGGFSYL